MIRIYGMILWAAVLLLLACGAGQQRGDGRDAAAWTEIQTPHFQLSTNLSPPLALDMARNLEETRAALLALAWTGARNPRGRTDVVVFARPTEFDRHSGLRGSIAGVSVSRPGFEPLLSFSPGTDNGLPEVAVHEMAHDLIRWFMPLQPAWLDEGLATYMQGLSFERSTKRASLGGISKSSVEWLEASGFVVRSANLFALDSFQHEDARHMASFYSSAWLLVHYLLNVHGDAFGRFQSRLAKLEPWRDAWQAEFHDVTHGALDQGLLAYAKRARFTRLEGELVLEELAPTVRSLSRAEVHGVLAYVSYMIGNVEVAERERAEAARLDPDELNALTVRYQLLDPGARQARLDIANRAIAVHPERAAAWLMKARAATSEAERSAALHKASGLAPDHPAVRAMLARESLGRGDANAAAQHSRVALRRTPGDVELIAVLAHALVRSKRCAEAERLESNAERLFGDGCTAFWHEASGPRRLSCTDYLRKSWAEVAGACTR